LLWGDIDAPLRGHEVAELPNGLDRTGQRLYTRPRPAIPLVAFAADPASSGRRAFLALDMAEIAWELVFSSPGLSSLCAAARPDSG